MLTNDTIISIENYIKLLNKETIANIATSADEAISDIISAESDKMTLAMAKRKAAMCLAQDIGARKIVVSSEMQNTTTQFVRELQKAQQSGAQQPASGAYNKYNQESHNTNVAGAPAFSDNVAKLADTVAENTKELAYLDAFEAKILDAMADLSAESERSSDIISFAAAIKTAITGTP